MNVSLVFVYLIFSCVSANFSSLDICCSSDSLIYKFRNSTTNFVKCIPAISVTNVTNSPEITNNTESPLGYGLDRDKESISSTELTDCAQTSFLNLSLYNDNSFNLLPNSCLIIQNKRLIISTCESNNLNHNLAQNIGFINKCCPHGYTYISELNKCLMREPDFNLYAPIFDKPIIFIDNSFECSNSKVLLEYVVTAQTIMFQENQLIWQDGSRSLKRSEFCIEAIDKIDRNRNITKLPNKKEQKYVIRSCQETKICDSLPCVRRCCSGGEIYFKRNKTTVCKIDEGDFVFQSFQSLRINGNFTKPSEFGILHGLECPKFRLDPDSFSDEEHTISSINGSLYIPSTSKMYTNHQYCIEKIKNASNTDQKLYTFVCFDSKVLGNDRIRFKMYPVGLLISCCFYAITLLVYISIEKLRNLPGKILICLVSSLLVAYLGIALGQLMPTSNNNLCFISGFFVYFFLMAAFSWMNITCFDIWKTFGSTKSKNVHVREQRIRFLWYSLYGWGMPCILTTITASLSKSGILPETLRPNFGYGRCWFTYDTIGYASLVFFSGPLGLLFIVNLVLFLLTLKYCNKVKREIYRMQSSNAEKPALRSRFFMEKTRFIMNTKLCFVMGITWLLEIASILFYDHKKNFFWSISDSFNVLLGVFVFFIFVFKRRVWKEVMRKLGFKTKNETRRDDATCLTQSTYATQSMSLKKLSVDKT